MMKEELFLNAVLAIGSVKHEDATVICKGRIVLTQLIAIHICTAIYQIRLANMPNKLKNLALLVINATWDLFASLIATSLQLADARNISLSLQELVSENWLLS